MIKERLSSKKALRKGLAGISLMTSAVLATACADKETKGVTDTNLPAHQPTATRITEASSITPTPEPTPLPTLEPTPTTEAKLTPEQMREIASNVQQLIIDGLAESAITPLELSKNPLASNDYLSPYFISTKIQLCDLSKYGQPLEIIGIKQIISPREIIYSVLRVVQPTDSDYASMFLQNCTQIGTASKVLYQVSGNEKFKLANESWKLVHKQIAEEVSKRDSSIKPGYWELMEKLYYNLESTLPTK